LTVSIIAVLNAFLALTFLPEFGYRLRIRGVEFLWEAGITAFLGVVVCLVTLITLLKAGSTNYPSFRCWFATMLWVLACFPVCYLSMAVFGSLQR